MIDSAKVARIADCVDKLAARFDAMTDALPPRTANTMSEAIALSSPSGSMSKRAKEAAINRLGEELFGPGGLQKEKPKQPGEKERLLRDAKMWRDLANRGMSTRKFIKQAEEAERMAALL